MEVRAWISVDGDRWPKYFPNTLLTILVLPDYANSFIVKLLERTFSERLSECWRYEARRVEEAICEKR